MKDKAELINTILNHKKYTSYLELGVGIAMETISQIKCEKTYSVDNQYITDSIPDFIGSTDSFFENNKEKYDVIYIDADHAYESVKKDFQNAIKSIKKGGIVLLHDIGPVSKQNTFPAASGTAYLAFIEIRANTKYEAFSYEFENGDILGIVKLKKNTDVLKNPTLDFEYYINNRDLILRKKNLEEIKKMI